MFRHSKLGLIIVEINLQQKYPKCAVSRRGLQEEPPQLLKNVLLEYQPGVRGKGFGALAKRYKVGKSGPSAKLIQLWWRKWNYGGRTLEALEPVAGAGRRSILTETEKQKHILKFVIHKNLIGEAVDYPEVHENVLTKTKKDISLTQVKAIGKNELDITWKKGRLSLQLMVRF
jgi:hypothetical protein